MLFSALALGGQAMFGLPFWTALMVFGFPLLWVVYTIAFLVVSRHWEGLDEEDL
jgi:hypothetical protein